MHKLFTRDTITNLPEINDIYLRHIPTLILLDEIINMRSMMKSNLVEIVSTIPSI
jgi:hypothetical protein